MYAEDDLLPISALQHLLFCERQCALIHLEGLWAENRLTAEGRRLHEKSHGERAGRRGGGMVETRRGVRVVRAMAIQSLRLGIAGVADVVEFVQDAVQPSPEIAPDPLAHRIPVSTCQTASNAGGRGGTALPVEYKRGRPKHLNWDRVQVCAQALCLEEMLGIAVPEAAIFYGAVRRRERITLDGALRAETEAAARRLRQLIADRITPPAVFEKKCGRCSLVNLCLPRVTTGSRSATNYLRRALQTGAEFAGPTP